MNKNLGWVLCDGSVIPKGVWQGSHTPNLNGEGRFLRGGNPDQVLSLENHMVQDHTHIDNGHSHTDAGHAHTYMQYWNQHGGPGHEGGGYNDAWREKTSGSSRANIQTSKSNLGGMNTGNEGSETRPINMRVIWIMKAW